MDGRGPMLAGSSVLASTCRTRKASDAAGRTAAGLPSKSRALLSSLVSAELYGPVRFSVRAHIRVNLGSGTDTHGRDPGRRPERH
jgi:hypothetical protein